MLCLNAFQGTPLLHGKMTKYTKTAMLFHWLIALLIIISFCLAVTMVNMPGFSPTKLKYFSWHKWLGVTIFGLSCLRLLWRLGHPAPPYMAIMPGWQKLAASGLHGFLYILILAIPVSGYLYSMAAGIPVIYLGMFPMPVIMDANPELKPLLKEIHFYLNMALLASFIIHALAALKHQFIDKDHTINRMLP
ncbi:cytochrome b561 [Oxalobacteraceae bacterium GrIS 2.11]